ncbi:MAG: GIY-YIG nuclease family protein [Patescibacteria group bacterium]
MFFTYILKSDKDNKYYYGSTANIDNRLLEHNSGKVIATKNRRPFKLIFSEEFSTRREAIKREFFFKKRSGYKWLKDNNII